MASRTSSVVDPKAVTLHVNVNGHVRKDPKAVMPLAIAKKKERNRRRRSPRHTGQTHAPRDARGHFVKKVLP